MSYKQSFILCAAMEFTTIQKPVKRRKLFNVFVDLEKAFDRMPRSAIEWALRRQLVTERLINLVMLLTPNHESEWLGSCRKSSP